jgi:S-(hydroxymethyl)glutathione dehydrogenase / alcohol dehydrogenase
MRAAVMSEPNVALSVEEVTPVEIRPTDVIVRIGASGLCHSDLLFLQGHSPFEPPLVLGHEGAGVVEDVGSAVRSVTVGDRVVCSWVPACGACWYCVRGETRHCPELMSAYTEPKLRRPDGTIAARMTGVGSFAEAAVLDERALVKVQTDLPDEQLALIGCGVTTGVGAALNTAAVAPGSTVVVLGCGGVGQSVIQGSRIAGAARIVAVDPVALKRDVALKLGATDAVDPGSESTIDVVKGLTGGRGADYAFEVAGLEPTLTSAFELIRPGGTIIMVGVQEHGARIQWSPLDMLMQGKTLRGCWYGGADVRVEFPRLIRLAESGRLDLASMVSRRITLDQVNDGLDAIERGEVIRSVIVN